MRRTILRDFAGAIAALLIATVSSPAMAENAAGLSTIRPLPGSELTLGQPAAASSASKKARPPVYSRYGSTTSTVIRPALNVPATSQTSNALNFYGGNSARATLSQMPRRTPLQAVPVLPPRPNSKPFQTVYRDPTISPYLNLYREDETTGSAPNYFAFVRPQMDQIEANRTQQRELQQLRGQLNNVSSSVVGASYQSGPLPGTGTPSRYMDTAQFYSGMRR